MFDTILKAIKSWTGESPADFSTMQVNLLLASAAIGPGEFESDKLQEIRTFATQLGLSDDEMKALEDGHSIDVTKDSLGQLKELGLENDTKRALLDKVLKLAALDGQFDDFETEFVGTLAFELGLPVEQAAEMAKAHFGPVSQTNTKSTQAEAGDGLRYNIVIRVCAITPSTFKDEFGDSGWYQRLIKHTGKRSDIKDDYVQFLNEIWHRVNATCLSAGFNELLRPSPIPVNAETSKKWANDVCLNISKYVLDDMNSADDFWSGEVTKEAMDNFEQYGEIAFELEFMGLTDRCLSEMCMTFTEKSLDTGVQMQVYDLQNQIYIWFSDGEWMSGSNEPGSLNESDEKWCRESLDKNPIPSDQARYILGD